MAIETYLASGQTGDNVVIGGATYTIATDFGAGGGTGFTGAHVQVTKTAWGDTDTVHRVSKVKPLPVQIMGAQNNNTGYTGAIIDSASEALKVTGGVRLQNNDIKIGDMGNHNARTNVTVTSIIQVVGPTFGKSGPTAYGVGRIDETHFAPVKVTGSVASLGADGVPFSVTFGSKSAKPEIRSLYSGPLGYTGATGYKLTTENRRTLEKDIDTVAVQGMHNGTPVGITATTGGVMIRKLRYPANGVPSSLETAFQGNTDGDRVGVIGIKGATAIEVTGGVRLSHMPAGGSFEVRSLSYGRDNIAVGGFDGSTAAHVKIFDSNGNPLGVSGNGALKVAIDNGTFTGNVTLSTNVHVKNATGDGLKIRGITGSEVVVKGPLSGGAIEVASPSGLNIRALSSNTDSISVGGAIGGDVNSLRNDLLGLRSYVSGTIGHDTTTIRNDIRNLRSQVSNLARAIEGFTGDDPNTINVAVKSTSQPRSLVSGSLRISNNPRSLGNNPLSSGVHIQADPANSGGVMLGGRSTVNNASTGFVLEPGDSIFLEISNTNQIFARSKNNLQQTINMIGS
jgi:hypothetical protein